MLLQSFHTPAKPPIHPTCRRAEVLAFAWSCSSFTCLVGNIGVMDTAALPQFLHAGFTLEGDCHVDAG